jgi:hypothetical protein
MFEQTEKSAFPRAFAYSRKGFSFHARFSAASQSRALP